MDINTFDVLMDDLISKAVVKDICDEGEGCMRDCHDKKAVVEYYLENPDWCLERGFPDIQTLRTHFADCGHLGVFVDQEFDGEELFDFPVCVFHNCKGTVRTGLNVKSRIIPSFYLANGSDIRIDTSDEEGKNDGIIIPVWLYDESAVSISGHGGSRLKCFDQ